ncbi:hypothetical protein AHAS_Ahas06G0114400 [Arachis hypogaea]
MNYLKKLNSPQLHSSLKLKKKKSTQLYSLIDPASPPAATPTTTATSTPQPRRMYRHRVWKLGAELEVVSSIRERSPYFVLEKGASYDPLKPNDQRWGFVRCVDALEHTVKLQWKVVSISNEDYFDGDKTEETVSAYELVEHPDYSFCFGDIVFAAQKQLGDEAGKDNGKSVTDLKAEASLEDGNQVHCVDEFPDNPFLCCVGNVTGFEDGNMEVNWANGITTKVAPYEVFRIEKHEGSSVISIPHETNVDELPQEMIEHRSLPSDKKGKERNERLFYKLLMEDVEELLPVVYAPTVGEACQKYGSIFMCPQGLYITLKEKGRILEVLRNWPEKNIQFIVVTDGERILGLGDLGCQGMGIPVGKLSLYTALGGVHPSACLPITIDVGTNNENSLNDELYIGLKQRRATGQEYDELMHEFMSAVKQNYGEKVLIQFKDFANHNAFDLLEKYRSTHLGTASVVLAGLVAALKLVGGNLADHRILFLGAGEAGTGIAELIALETSKQTNAPLDEVPKNIWLVDSKGLIVGSRKELLQHFKKPWAHDHEPVHRLVDDVNKIKPTVLIGTSGQGRTSTTEVIEAMASTNEKPIILSLSNPSSQSECTAEEAYKWSQVSNGIPNFAASLALATDLEQPMH